MKTQKLLIIAASVCLLVVFFSGSAYAGPLAPIKSEFCTTVEAVAADAFLKLVEATEDVVDCAVEFEDCRSGFASRDLENCISEYSRCNSRGNRDQEEVCRDFSEDFGAVYEEALRQSGFLNLEFRFLRWSNTNAKARECLEPAIYMFDQCAKFTGDPPE